MVTATAPAGLLATASVARHQFVFLSFSAFGRVNWRLSTIKGDVYRRTLRCQEKAIRLGSGVSAVFVSRAGEARPLEVVGQTLRRVPVLLMQVFVVPTDV